MTRTALTLTLLLVGGTLPAAARVLHVRPGDSIQAAVDAAHSGDLVMIAPGTYHEAGRPCPTEPANTCAVVVDKDGITLMGQSARAGAVVLENAGGQDQGIAIAKQGADGATCLGDPSQRIHGARVRGLTVNGFGGDGIFLFCVDGWSVEFASANDDAEYGIFPSHCGPGRVSNSVATGANDTGIYIGQSNNVRIDHNVAMGNVSGFELENCSHSRLDHNEAAGNTGGVLTFTNIFLDVKQNSDNRVDHNFSHDNNKPNSCLDPSDEVCAVPPGTGLLVLATDRNQVDHNIVTGNDSFGIAVANFCVANNLSPADCAALDIEPNPDFNRILFNVATGNGTAPSPLINPVFAVDLAWDETGTGNCWTGNVADTTFPADLPSCF
jgi:cytochrome c peroxidase